MDCFVPYGRGASEMKLGQKYGISSPFMLPKDMTIEDACKVISYLSEKVEAENELEPACYESVAMVSKVLSNYGFVKVESANKGYFHVVSEYEPFKTIEFPFDACKEIEGVVDLITVGGQKNIFKKSELNERYFDWFTENVSAQDVKDIYTSIRREYLLPEELRAQKDKTKEDYMFSTLADDANKLNEDLGDRTFDMGE